MHSLFLFVAVAAIFQATAASAELKVGVYDNRKILEALPSVQKEFQKLNAEFEPKQKEISDLQSKLLKLKETQNFDSKMSIAPYTSETKTFCYIYGIPIHENAVSFRAGFESTIQSSFDNYISTFSNLQQTVNTTEKFKYNFELPDKYNSLTR